MHSRYILQSILINKDESKLTDAISWLLNNQPEFKLNSIEENGKYFIIKQNELSKNYFPIMRKPINDEYGIHLLFYSNNIFPIPAVKSHVRD